MAVASAGRSRSSRRATAFKVAFPEATQLGLEADVRVAGVSVGKVRKKTLDHAHRNRTLATIEIDRKFAPLRQGRARDPAPEDAARRDLRRADARARARRDDPRGRRLADARVAKTVELDEIFQALDPQDARGVPGLAAGARARASTGRGRDLNDALGNAARASPTTAPTC